METFGEDPFLTGRMAVAFVTGMQGDDPKYLKVVSTPKHFAVHSGPEPLRHRFNVDVTPHDLEDTYLPAFRAAVTEGHAQSVMCAYNAIDGAPACASEMLLQDHLRNAWGFHGYVVSDCGAIDDVTSGHHFAPDLTKAGVVSLKAGTDNECGSAGFPKLGEAVKQGLVTEAQLDTALTRLFTARFRLGMFDAPESYAYGRIPFSENNSPQHRQLALQAAREVMVLLKNDGVLPLAAGRKPIAVIGPTAELVQAVEGNYNGTPPQPVSPMAGIVKRFGAAHVASAQGSLLAEGFAVPIERSAFASGKVAGLKGEYFANPDLQGQPAAVKVDPSINFNWSGAVPIDGLPRDGFSVRWTGTFTPPAAGDYRLGSRVNRWGARDAVQLYLDGKLVLDSIPAAGGRRGPMKDTVVHFADTKSHQVRLEYRHRGGNAGLDLTWVPPAGALQAEAVAVARKADVVLAVLGLSPQLEGEEMPVHLEGFNGGDRTDIALPRPQRDLLTALRATGKPLVLVLTTGSALAVDSTQADAGRISTSGSTRPVGRITCSTTTPLDFSSS